MNKLPNTPLVRTILPVIFLTVTVAPILCVLIFASLLHLIPETPHVAYVTLGLSLVIGLILFIAFLYTSNVFHKESEILREELDEVVKGNFHKYLNDSTGSDFDNVNKTFMSMETLVQANSKKTEETINVLLQENVKTTTERDRMIAVLSGLTHGVITIDTNKKILFFNKASEQMFGIPLEKCIGKHVDEIVKFYDKNELITANLYIEQSESISQKFKEHGLELINSQGARVIVSLSTTFVSFKDGSSGWILNFHDISKQIESDAMKIDFVSMAAHELRTPLTSVRGYASLLKMEKAAQLDDDGQELVDRLMTSSEILGNFIENLLNVTRIEQNRFVLAIKPIDLTQTIKDAVNNLEQLAKTKNQKLELQIKDKLPIVMADSFRINQVLTNLVANALHYTFDGGNIMVVAEVKDAYLQVSVTDTGQGIPVDALPKLFTKFFRVSGVLEQGAKGTGLGLFISKSIIEMHKGKIWVTSEQGKGSTFTFILPTADQQMLQQ